MALPVMSTPIYEVTIPSTDEVIKYRPFLVKEEKALLIAQQSEDLQVMVNTLKQVIRSCTMDAIDADSLSVFDIEYLFSQIRAKSVGEVISLVFKCDTCTDEKAKVKVDIDLTKLQVTKPEGHTKKIPLFGDVGILMKYPSIEVLSKFQGAASDDVEVIFKIICSSIELIYSGEEIYYTKDQKPEEVEDFVNNLTQEQFMLLQNFFETMPKLVHTVEYECPLCSKHHSKNLEGLDAFFT